MEYLGRLVVQFFCLPSASLLLVEAHLLRGRPVYDSSLPAMFCIHSDLNQPLWQLSHSTTGSRRALRIGNKSVCMSHVVEAANICDKSTSCMLGTSQGCILAQRQLIPLQHVSWILQLFQVLLCAGFSCQQRASDISVPLQRERQVAIGRPPFYLENATDGVVVWVIVPINGLE